MDTNQLRTIWQTITGDLESQHAEKTYTAPNLFMDSWRKTESLKTLSQISTLDGNRDTFSGTDTLAAQESMPLASLPHHLAATSNYQLIQEIARGGMGIIFKGYQNSLQREVAIKKLQGSTRANANQHKFVAEAMVTAYLEHPNIVPVHELEIDKREVLLTMKLVVGNSWKELLRSQQQQRQELSSEYLQQQLDILLSVGNAVAFANMSLALYGEKSFCGMWLKKLADYYHLLCPSAVENTLL